MKSKASRPQTLITKNQTSDRIRKFHRSFRGKSRVQTLLTNPAEARKGLKKVIENEMFTLHNKDFDKLTDTEVLKLMKDVLMHVAELEKEECQ